MDFSDSHAGINFLVGDTHPDKTIMLMSFSLYFFPDFKVVDVFLFVGEANYECRGHAYNYTHTHSNLL